jgi:hypothetical protein
MDSNKYIGKVCPKHPELEGLRYKRNWNCPACVKSRQTKFYYGITQEEKIARLEAQGYVCAICNVSLPKEGRGASFDHNHTTMQLRKFLCVPCNCGIGNFKESPDLLLRAIEYLKEHSS